MQYLTLLALTIFFVIAAILLNLTPVQALAIWGLGAGWGYVFAQKEDR